jgi:DNA replication licensing factor MCM6
MACGNTKNWTLVKEESTFVDWQRAKVQENADEVRGLNADLSGCHFMSIME